MQVKAVCCCPLCRCETLVSKHRLSPAGRSQVRSCCCRFFDEISQDTGKFVFGVGDTLQCLEMGAVETLIVWENLEVSCISLRCQYCHIHDPFSLSKPLFS